MIRRLLTIVFLLAVFLLPTDVRAEGSGFYIKFYDVEIKVNEDNTFDIRETIVTEFTEEKHGIIRKLPLINYVRRNDGSSSVNRVEISDIAVQGWEYSLDREYDEISIKIGSSSEYIIGENSFVITYHYDIGRDPLRGLDEFYFNLIGTQWTVPINEVHFKITFPKSIPSGKIGFSHGPEGSQSFENVYYNLLEDNTVLEGSFFETLDAYEGLSIRVELPEKYFYRPWSWQEIKHYLWILIPAVCLAAYGFVFRSFGKDEPVIETVEFYPPDDLDPLELAFQYKGEISLKDISTVFIYLASKGYLKIRGDGDDFTIVLLKEAMIKEDPALSHKMNHFYRELYKLGELDDDGNLIATREVIKSGFSDTVRYLAGYYNASVKRREVIRDNKLLRYIGINIGLYMLLVPVVYFAYDQIGFLALIMPMIFIIMFTAPLLIGMAMGRSGVWIIGIMIILVGLMNAGMLLFFFFSTGVMDLLVEDKIYLALSVASVIMGIAVLVMAMKMDKRTHKNTEILGRIRGFRNFLMTAEKDRLEALVNENPEYFFDILPYAYVLGVSREWTERFEDVVCVQPQWVEGWDYYGYSDMYSAFDRTFYTIASDMLPPSRSSVFSSSDSSDFSDFSSGYSSSDYSSSSSSSGGGSSGGGSGGGGGDSW